MLSANVTPFEWIQSPIVYREMPGFREDLWALCPHYFSQRANIQHYLGIARGAMESMGGDGSIKIKKLFYVLRPLLAAKWCLERNTIAPMEIGPMLPLLPEDLRAIVGQMIVQKRDAAEGFVIQLADSLKVYLEQEIAACSAACSMLDRRNSTVEQADDFFRKTLDRYDYSGT